MKQKNLAEELEFVRSATERELLTFVKTAHFSHVSAEKELIKRNFPKVAALYLQNYGFQPGARIAVFRQNLHGLMKMLLTQKQNHQNIAAEFFAHGEYHTIRQYIATAADDLSEIFPEETLFAANNVNELHRLAANRKLTPFAQYEIIRRNTMSSLTRAIIMSGPLNEREKLCVMEYAEWEEVNLLIEIEKNPVKRQMLEEMQLIRFAHRHKIAKFIATDRFCKNAERFFFKHGDFTLLVSYIKHYNIKGGHEIIISRAGSKEILGYLSQNRLCEKGEKLLLDRRKHSEIKAYIKGHYFSEDNETRFIKRGRHNEIMLYIARHSLCDTAQCELMYRRNSTEIEYFVSHYPLANIAEMRHS